MNPTDTNGDHAAGKTRGPPGRQAIRARELSRGVSVPES